MHIVISDPRSRIEGWLVQIERIAQAAIAELEPKIAASWRRAEAAGKRRRRLEKLAKASGLPSDVAAYQRAVRDERRALERAQPDAWFDARNALRNAECVRRALVEASLEEAVEFAFHAMNAAWKLTGEQIEPVVKAGIKARSAASRGGKKRAERHRAQWDERTNAIRKRHAQMAATGEQSPAEVRSALAGRFRVSRRTIDRKLGTRTRQVSKLLGTVASGPAEDFLTHECGSQAPKVRKQPPLPRVGAGGDLSARRRAPSQTK